VKGTKLIEAVNDALENQGAYLENFGHQQHLEELLMHRSKSLENKIGELEVLNQKFAELPAQTEMPDIGVAHGPT
jgi:hypothetical protein|tara:strand:- start:131 stop:355 length:225 start_codon:yes stop_codon:yes gene_type:complete